MSAEYTRGIAELLHALLPSPIADDLVQYADDVEFCASITSQYLEADRDELRTYAREQAKSLYQARAKLVSARWAAPSPPLEKTPEEEVLDRKIDAVEKVLRDSRADMIAFHLGPLYGSGGVDQLKDAHDRLGGEGGEDVGDEA